MKKFILLICFLFVSTVLVGCNLFSSSTPTVSSIEVVGQQEEYDQAFKLSDLSVQVTKSDGTKELVPLTDTMISDTDLAKLNEIGTHTINVSYLNLATSFTITVTGEKGDPGQPGREVMLQVANGYIQWKYSDETTWKNLVALADLKGATGATGPTGQTGQTGPQGPAGTNGKEVEFQVASGYIQWRYVGDTNWVNLLDLSSLQGSSGTTPTITISDDGYWVINGEKTTYKAVADSANPILCSVTFDLDGGVMPDGVNTTLENINKGDTIVLPIPTKDGYIFKGWFSGDTVNDAQFTNITPVTKDITLYAHWELDLTQLKAFFDTFYSTNFTSSQILSYTSNINGENVRMLETDTFSVFEENSRIYVHKTNTSQTFSDENLKGEENFDKYNLYVGDNCYDLIFSSDSNHWFLSLYKDQYEQTMELEMFDINLFTKRDGANIYDYELTEQFLRDLSIPFSIVDGSSYTAECYVDLDLNKFVFNVNLTNIVEGSQYTSSFGLELSLSDVGTTTVTIPLDLAKGAVIYAIDEAVNNKQIEDATEQSLNELNNLISQMKQNINDEVSFTELCKKQMDMVLQIENFNLDIDQLKQTRNEALAFIEHRLQELSTTATDDSIIAMTTVYNLYLPKINAATSMDEISGYLYQFENEINAKYEIDKAKFDLLNAKEELKQRLNEIVKSYVEILQDPSNSQQLWDIYNNYSDLFNAATSFEQLEALFNSAIYDLAQINLPVIQKGFDDLKLQASKDLKETYEKSIALLNYSDDINTTFITYNDLINAATDFPSLLNAYATGKTTLESMILTEVRVEVISELNAIYQDFLNIVVETEQTNLTNLYNQYVDRINNERDTYLILSFSNQFASDCSTLQMDPLLSKIYYRVLDLQNQFDFLCYNATSDSIIAMQQVLDLNIPNIKASTTVDEVEFNYQNAYNELNNAYIKDPTFEQLQETKNYTISKMWDISSFIEGETENQQELDSLWNLYYDYVNLINEATNIADVDNYYNQWHQNLMLLSFSFNDARISQIKNNYLTELDQLFNLYTNLPNDIIQQFQNYRDFISNSSNLIEIHYNYLLCKELIDESYFDSYKQEILNNLLEDYNYYSEIILEDYLSSLDSKYNYYVDLVNNAQTQSEITGIDDVFYDYCYSLPVDELKQAKIYSINNLQEEMESYTYIATDESYSSMLSIFNNFCTLINNSTSLEDINNYFFLALDEIKNAYVIDYSKIALHHEAEVAINKIYYLSSLLESKLQNKEDESSIWALHDQFIKMINESTSIADVQSAYDNWFTALENKNLVLIDGALDNFKTFFIQDLAEFYTEFIYLPDTIISQYQNYEVNINNATSIFGAYLFYTSCQDVFNNYIVSQIRDMNYENIHSGYENYRAMVQDSEIALLDSTYNQVIQNLNNCYYEEDMNNISQNFSNFLWTLQVDILKANIRSYIDSLHFELALYSETATSESIDNMTNIVNSYEITISSCTDANQVSNYYEEAINILLKLYSPEPTKVELYQIKTNILYMMEDIYYNYTNYLVDSNDEFYIENAFYYYQNLINQATTIDEINSIYNTFINDLVAKNYEVKMEILEGVKAMALQDLDYCFQELINPNMDIENTYQDFVNQINNATDVMNVFDLYYECLDEFAYFNLTQAQQQALAEMQAIYNEYVETVIDDEVSDLIVFYNHRTNNILNAIDHWAVNSQYELFLAYIGTLHIDSTKVQRYIYIKDFQNEYNNYAKIATSDSIATMYQIMVDFKTEIALITDSSDMEYLYFIKSNLLYDAFYEDSAKYDFDLAKSDSIQRLSDFYFLASIVCSDDLVIANINDIYENYEELINNAQNIAQVETLFTSGYNEMIQLNMPIDQSQIEYYKGLILSYMNDEYNIYSWRLINIPQNTTDFYNTCVSLINLETDPINIYLQYWNFKIGSFNEVVTQYRIEIIPIMEDNYNHYVQIIVDSELPKFNGYYQSVVSFINSSNDLDMIYTMKERFLTLCDNSTIDEFKQQKYEAKIDLFNYFEYCSNGATAEQVTAMESIYNEYIGYLDSCTNSTDLYNTLNQGYTLIAAINGN